MSEVKYQKRDGFRIKGDVQAIGERLASLIDKKGTLEPKKVVTDASDPKSPLHKNFEWDDTEAATQYRLVQARYLIGSFEIIYEENDYQFQHRAFVSLDMSDAPYTESRTVLTDAQQRAMWLDQALRELDTWKAKYRHIQELNAVYDAIGECKGTKKKPKPKVERPSKGLPCPRKEGEFIKHEECLDISGEASNITDCRRCENFPVVRNKMFGPNNK